MREFIKNEVTAMSNSNKFLEQYLTFRKQFI